MRTSIASIVGVAACAVVVSCQPATPPPKLTSSPETSQVKPLPRWTKQSVGSPDGRQLQFAIKLIEISRLDDANLPKGVYRKKMSAAETEAWLRELMQTKGVDLMTSPKVVTQEGKPASAKVGREMVFGEGANARKEFVGVANYVRGRPGSGSKIKVDTLVEVKEFEGFADEAGEHPVIAVRRAGSDGYELNSGESLLIGGVLSKREQDVEDRLPLLGDIPMVGELFSKSSTETVHCELLVLVMPSVVGKD